MSANTVRVQPTQMGIAVFTPKSTKFLTLLKRHIPAVDRAFSGAERCWYVSPVRRQALIDVIYESFGERLEVPAITLTPPLVTQEFKLDYVGQCKARDNGTSSASGSVADDWLCVLPEDVLRAFFNQGNDVSGAGNPENVTVSLYSTLGLPVSALASDIKSNFRRLARTWHPDVSQEPGSAEMFIKIEHAYRMLSDPIRKRKYDAGLAMEKCTASGLNRWDADYRLGLGVTVGMYGTTLYQPPYRCGLVTAEWSAWLGKYTAKRILAWNDITRADGKVAVASWARGAERFTTRWV